MRAPSMLSATEVTCGLICPSSARAPARKRSAAAAAPPPHSAAPALLVPTTAETTLNVAIPAARELSPCPPLVVGDDPLPGVDQRGAQGALRQARQVGERVRDQQRRGEAEGGGVPSL